WINSISCTCYIKSKCIFSRARRGNVCRRSYIPVYKSRIVFSTTWIFRGISRNSFIKRKRSQKICRSKGEGKYRIQRVECKRKGRPLLGLFLYFLTLPNHTLFQFCIE